MPSSTTSSSIRLHSPFAIRPRETQSSRGSFALPSVLCMRKGADIARISAPSSTSMGTRTPVFAVRGRRLNRLTMEAKMAAELGFEPRQHESESWVLPLHNSALSLRSSEVSSRQRGLLYRISRRLSIPFFENFCGNGKSNRIRRDAGFLCRGGDCQIDILYQNSFSYRAYFRSSIPASHGR